MPNIDVADKTTLDETKAAVAEAKALLDSIYALVDTEIATLVTNTKANSTASTSGTLSQKLTSIINSLANSTYGLSALKTAIGNAGGAKALSASDTVIANKTWTAFKITGSSTYTLISFTPSYSGTVKLIATHSSTNGTPTLHLKNVTTNTTETIEQSYNSSTKERSGVATVVAYNTYQFQIKGWGSDSGSGNVNGASICGTLGTAPTLTSYSFYA